MRVIMKPIPTLQGIIRSACIYTKKGFKLFLEIT